MKLKRYFEFIGGTSRKFWEVEVDGVLLHRRWGRIGTNGQTQTATYGTPRVAMEEAGRLMAEKRSKGYVERPASAPSSSSLPPAPTAPLQPKPTPKPEPVDVNEVIALLVELEDTAPIDKETAVEAAAALYREMRGE